METSLVVLDSIQFNDLSLKAELLLSNLDSTKSITNNILNESGQNNIDPWWLIVLEFFIAPSLIVMISVWLTNFITKSKEYKRISKLNDFVNIWLRNIIEGLNEQIRMFETLKITYKSIEYDGIRPFNYVNVDIQSIMQLSKTDLQKLFISFRKGNVEEKSQNYYDLLFGLNSFQEIINDYKVKSSELNQRSVQISDHAFEIFKKLIAEERNYTAFTASQIRENANYKSTPQYLAFKAYMDMANARQNYFTTEVGKMRTKRAIYFFSKKLVDICNSNLHNDSFHTLLLEINTELILSISQMRDYYVKIQIALENKILETRRFRDIITIRQTYFNNLKIVNILRFED